MSSLIYDELTLFFICMITGAALASVYDGIRIVRMLIHHRDWIVDLEDLMFWIGTAWVVFRILFAYNQGQFRAYAFLGLFLGFGLYIGTVSRLLFFVVNKIMPYYKKILSYVKKPFSYLKRRMRKGLKNLQTQVKMAIKSR